jgi:hypothetical protein
MRVVDQKKEQAKGWLSADIVNNITRLTDKAAQINAVISRVDFSLGGSRVNSDRALIDICRKSLFEIERAVESLRRAQAYVSLLDIYVEVGDDE